jgi:hypothetical protein
MFPTGTCGDAGAWGNAACPITGFVRLEMTNSIGSVSPVVVFTALSTNSPVAPVDTE